MANDGDHGTGPRGIVLVLICVALCMGIFVLNTVDYGLPQQFDPDERYFIISAINLLAPPVLDPGWYGHPASTLHLLLSVLYACHLIVEQLFYHDSKFYNNDISLYIFFILGRILVAGIYLVCALTTLKIARMFLTEFSSVFVFVLMLTFPQIIYYSNIIRADLLLILLLNIVFLYCMRIVIYGGKFDYILSGIFIGLATVTKYPGLIGVVPFLVASLIDCRTRRRTVSGLAGRTAFAGFASALSAFIVAPFLFLKFDQVVADIAVQGHARLGVASEGFLSTLWFYLTIALPSTTGTWPLLMSIVGLIWAGSKMPKVLPLLAFGAAFLIFMSLLPLHWVRWMLPLTPIVALGVGAFSDFVLSLLGVGRFRSYAIVVCLMVLGSIPSIAQSTELLVNRARNADTRIASEQWVEANLPCGSVILLESYAPQLENGCHTVLVPQGGRLVGVDGTTTIGPRPPAFFGSFGSELKGAPLSLLDNSKIDFIIESSWRERFTAEAALYREEIQVYEAISDRTTELKTFDAGDELLGPSIVIYSINK